MALLLDETMKHAAAIMRVGSRSTAAGVFATKGSAARSKPATVQTAALMAKRSIEAAAASMALPAAITAAAAACTAAPMELCAVSDSYWAAGLVTLCAAAAAAAAAEPEAEVSSVALRGCACKRLVEALELLLRLLLLAR